MTDQNVKNFCNNYRFGLDPAQSHLLNNNNPGNNNMISISTNVLKSVHSMQQQQQPALNNLSPNIRNNRLGQKYLANANSNYYESFGVTNPIASSNNQISPLIK